MLGGIWISHLLRHDAVHLKPSLVLSFLVYIFFNNYFTFGLFVILLLLPVSLQLFRLTVLWLVDSSSGFRLTLSTILPVAPIKGLFILLVSGLPDNHGFLVQPILLLEGMIPVASPQSILL
jgi:hypothetical protein